MSNLIKSLLADQDPLEPETLTQLHPELSDIERELLMVIKVIRDTDTVFEDMDVFENAVHVINGIKPDIAKTELAKPEWIWYALTFMKNVRSEMDLANEIKEYIKYVYHDNGIKFYPPLADIANPILDKIVEKATNGPFPLKDETFINIQAVHYLKIMEYLKLKKSKK